MGISRPILKRQSKDCMRQSFNSILVITSIYILLTVWLPNILEIFFPNPANTFLTGYEDLMLAALEKGQEISIVVLNQLVRDSFLGAAASVGLFLALVMYFFSTVMDFGYALYCLTLRRKGQAGAGELFRPFQITTKIILTEILQLIFVSLWSILLIIPGLVAAYSYRQAIYLILDDPELSPLQAIRQSKKLMRGHKAELFALDLSFFGWVLLESVLANLGYSLLGMPGFLVLDSICCLLLLPYMGLTRAGYYDILRTAAPPPPLREQRTDDDPWNM